MSYASCNTLKISIPLVKFSLTTLFFRRCVRAYMPSSSTLKHASPHPSQVLKRLTSSVSCALDEAAAALTRMRSDPPGGGAGGAGGGATGAPTSGSASAASSAGTADSERSLVEACNEGDINKVGTYGLLRPRHELEIILWC